MKVRKIAAGLAACVLSMSAVLPVSNVMPTYAGFADREYFGKYHCEKIDEDNDGTYDYMKIVNSYSDTSAVSVEIPAEIGGLPVKAIGAWAFYKCEALTSVTLPDSITTIEKDAFYTCNNLTSINIPASVTTIEAEAFSSLARLTEISVSEDNEYFSIEDGVLFNKDKTKLIKYNAGSERNEYVIPDSVTEIESSAFINSVNLKSITIPDNITKIERFVFCSCENLTDITIPDKVTEIGSHAFAGCKSIKSITIPDSVTSIGSSAFYHCENLESINIGKELASIEDDTFNTTYYSFDVSSLKEISVSGDNEYFSSEDGVLFDKDKTKLIKYPAANDRNEYAVPDSVTEIAKKAFELSYYLESVSIGNSVTAIGEYAFRDCDNLVKITIPDSVTSIGKYAFYYCKNIVELIIPDSVDFIGEYAFNECKSLKSIKIPDRVMNQCTFGYCESLESITLPDGITSIKENMFRGCSSLKDITIPDSVKVIESYAFYGCSSLENITIPNSVTRIEDGAFECKALVNITIPESVTELEDDIFSCPNLESITIKNPECVIYDYRPIVCNHGTTKDSFYGTVYGYTDSTAQSYAKALGYNFESLGEKPPKKGDTNCDGKVTVADVVVLQKYLVGTRGLDKRAADINGDGAVNVFDVILLKRML